MAEYGFIRDMLDVKVLILFVLDHAEKPLSLQCIYELCYQDDRLSYFDVCEAVPQLTASGHLNELEDGTYEITEKGRENVAITGDSVAFTVRESARAAVEEFNKESARKGRVRTEVLERDGNFSVAMELCDDCGKLMTMELAAPSKKQARKLAAAFHNCAEMIYSAVMEDLLMETESDE